MQAKLVIAALGTAMIAAPAAAWDDPQGNSVATKAPERTYCLQFGLETGTRINRVECKTRKEWAQLGVDIDELLRK